MGRFNWVNIKTKLNRKNFIKQGINTCFIKFYIFPGRKVNLVRHQKILSHIPKAKKMGFADLGKAGKTASF